jgi:site-specific recombinase XerD
LATDPMAVELAAPPSQPSPIKGEGESGDGDIFQRYGRYLRGQRGLSENTVRIYQSDLDSFRRFLTGEGLSFTDLDRQVLRRYLAWLATEAKEGYHGKEGYARVSITRKLTALRSFYRYLVQERVFRTTPVPSGRTFQVKVEKHLPTFLGKQEVQRLLETPDDATALGLRDRAILEVLYSCGVRLAEIQGIDLTHLDLERRQILVRGKGSKERWVLFGRPTQEALERYLRDSRLHLAHRPTPALFLNRYGDRLSRRSIELMVSRYAARAGLRQGVHPHTLRHTFASHMLEGEADLRVIQELLGHSSPTTTQIYTHVTKQEARAAYLNFHPRAAEA